MNTIVTENKEYFTHKNITLIQGNSLNENLFSQQFIDLSELT